MRAGEQKKVDYLASNPNGKIPAMIDNDSVGDRILSIESSAILIYLADKSGQLGARLRCN